MKVEGTPYTTLLDSGSQVTIIFDSWYTKHLTHIPLHPVSGLAISGLSDSNDSYPYQGYIQVELKLPENVACDRKSITVLALVCPDPRCSDNIPILVGTNMQRVRLSQDTPQAVRSFRVHTPDTEVRRQTQSMGLKCRNPDPEVVGEVKWPGPGPLIIPAASQYIAVCTVEEKQPWGKTILLTKRVPSTVLPPSVFVQPTVVFSAALNKNKFLVLLRNESLKEKSIPGGTVIAQMHVADTVTVGPRQEQPPARRLDPKMFDFGDSPIPRESKDRLTEQLSR